MIILVFLLILTGFDIYLYNGIRPLFSAQASVFTGLYFLISAASVIGLILYGSTIQQAADPPPFIDQIFAFGMVVILAKALAIAPLLLQDVYRSGQWLLSSLSQFSIDSFPKSSTFFSYWAAGQWSIMFLVLMYGVAIGKYDFQVQHHSLTFENLPQAFDGFKVLQISDAHLGAFKDPAKVDKAIALIQEQKADAIVFTGDMVNNLATEASPFVEKFASLQAPYGKYTILGNHDYAEYVPWPSEKARQQNLQHLIQLEKTMGFQVLMNESASIEKDGESINIVGVENWGIPPFPQYGDLKRAMQDNDPNDFNILLSHDPSHWEQEVWGENIALTLSGHTHGMQFGIKIGNWEWSPVKWKYERWGGLYQKAEQYLYVNRGFGSHGYPGRVGMAPEITVLELKRG
ncbi:metallophosphoesterase [Persicobacter diffluens]|uniref:Phosphoesterase n=1 Tax=Persicobacter diffluens TaxID=981 RepID=A0AAN4W1E4_9BACT|nr:phosphoesterase [Persicobacter diffluens]